MSAADNHVVSVWDAHAREGENACRALGRHRARVWELSSSLSGRALVSASGDSTIKLWNPDAENEVFISFVF